MHKNAYAVAPSSVDIDVCDEIIRIGELFDKGEAKTGRKDATAGITRSSTVSWLTEEQANKHDINLEGMYSNLNSVMGEAAQNAGWGEWVINNVQPYQYTCYGPGDHYDWHPDTFSDPMPETDPNAGMIRKLSFTLLLSDQDDYEGGGLLIEDHQRSGPDELWNRITNMNVVPEYTQKGTMIVFPSHLWHKVLPIKRGIRKSLVGWFMGPPWV